MLKRRVVQQGVDPFQRDVALANAGMQIAVAAARGSSIIEMNNRHAATADIPINLGDEALYGLCIAEVIPCAPEMGGIKTNPQLLVMFWQHVQNGGQMLNPIADFMACSDIIFQQHKDSIRDLWQYPAQAGYNALEADLEAGSAVAADVEDDMPGAKSCCTLDGSTQQYNRFVKNDLIWRGQIDEIRRMHNDW